MQGWTEANKNHKKIGNVMKEQLFICISQPDRTIYALERKPDENSPQPIISLRAPIVSGPCCERPFICAPAEKQLPVYILF